MLNIIIPIYEPNDLNENSFPILDIVNNKSIFAWSLEHLEKYQGPKRYYIISTDNLISKTHIDKIIKLYTKSEVRVIRLQKNTLGAPCAILMGIDQYNLDEEFLLTSPDQFIDVNLEDHLQLFKDNKSDAGTIGFKSIHLKWSYAEINHDNTINRIVEKIPISNNALTSTYYFKNGSMMTNCLSKYILRGELTNNKYYIAPCFNELIIRKHKIFYSKISSDKYYNFYSEDIKKTFISYINNKKDNLIDLTNRYFEMLKDRDFENITSLFSEDISIVLSDKKIIKGIDATKEFFIKNLSAADNSLLIDKITKIDDESTYCNFSLISNSINYDLIDKIYFNKINNKICNIKRYSFTKHEEI